MNTQYLFRARRQRLLAAIGSDATLWFAHPDTLRYLAGFHVDPFSLGHGFGGVLALKTDGSTTLWYDDRLPDSVGAACVDQAIIVPWYDGITPARGLRSQAVLNHLPNEWPGCFHDFPGQSDSLFNCVEILANLRRCKDEHEIAVLEQCCRAGEAGHAWARAHLEPGMTELQLYAGINRACTLAAGHAVIVYGDFAVSPGPSRKGGPATDRVIRPGDLVIVDFSVVIGGYRSDFTTTLCAGVPTKAQKHLHATAMEGMRRGEAKLFPDVPAHDVHAAVFSAFADAGMPEAFPHHAGHGIGLSHPEAPFFVPGSTEILVEGDVVTLEPGAYVAGVGGLRIEHNYLITANGPRVLSGHDLGL